mgnify:CR=1 FL=1
MKNIGLMIVAPVLLAGTVFGASYLALQHNSYFAPKYEALRRDTMLQSRAYGEATTRELYRLKLQYQKAATTDHRDTIKAMILHEVRSGDPTLLPFELQNFITEIGE